MPELEGSPLYTFQVDEEWILVESSNETVVYAYGNIDMTILNPGEGTSALINQMTIRPMSHAEYSSIGDINVTVTGYAIGTEAVDSTPGEAWSMCK